MPKSNTVTTLDKLQAGVRKSQQNSGIYNIMDKSIFLLSLCSITQDWVIAYSKWDSILQPLLFSQVLVLCKIISRFFLSSLISLVVFSYRLCFSSYSGLYQEIWFHDSINALKVWGVNELGILTHSPLSGTHSKEIFAYSHITIEENEVNKKMFSHKKCPFYPVIHFTKMKNFILMPLKVL